MHIHLYLGCGQGDTVGLSGTEEVGDPPGSEQLYQARIAASL